VVLAADAWAQAHADFDRFQLNSITLVEFGGDWWKLIKLVEFGRIRLTWQNLAEFDQSVGIYLLSVSPRHSYCNWASPVTNYTSLNMGLVGL